jgi:hypothetical protein
MMSTSDVMHACMAVIRRWQLYMIDDDGLLVLACYFVLVLLIVANLATIRQPVGPPGRRVSSD